jgi:hypothetical protein
MLLRTVWNLTDHREDVSKRLVCSHELRSRRGNRGRSSCRVEEERVFFDEPGEGV